MNPQASTRPAMSLVGAACAAAFAAASLSACNPHDASSPVAYAGGAAPTTSSAQTPLPADPNAPPTQSMPQGQPVPPPPNESTRAPVYQPAPRVATAPTYANAPTYVAQAPAYSQAPTYEGQPPARVVREPVASNHVGSIESIEPIRTRPQGSGAGAVIGGVLGGLVGNQFGHGLGRAAVTGAGAVGGALAGNNVERNMKEGVSGYRVSVRLDNGNTRTFERSSVGDLHVGDRVRVESESFHRV